MYLAFVFEEVFGRCYVRVRYCVLLLIDDTERERGIMGVYGGMDEVVVVINTL